jgi:hypothetical protein
MIDKEFFVKCLTEGIPVYGAAKGEEERFVELLNRFLIDNNHDSDVIHYTDEPNVILFELEFASPFLGLSVENEYLLFFQTNPEDNILSSMSEHDMKMVGNLTLKVVSFVSAWNKKILGILDEQGKAEYNKIAMVKDKYDPSKLYKKYINKVDYYNKE